MQSRFGEQGGQLIGDRLLLWDSEFYQTNEKQCFGFMSINRSKPHRIGAL